MNCWSENSQAVYDTLCTELQTLVMYVLRFYDCSLLCGYRPEVAQNSAYASGHSDKQWPDSRHNTEPSEAVDMAAYLRDVDTYDKRECLSFSAYVLGCADTLYQHGLMSRRVRCGNGLGDDERTDRTPFDWDLCHLELI